MTEAFDGEDDLAPEAAEAEIPAGGKQTKKQLIEAIAASTGQKKTVVRPVVEATLAELSAALGKGDTLVLPPLGRLSVARIKPGKAGEIKVLKLRGAKAGSAAAADDEDN